MRCKDIERLIIDSSDEDLSSEELDGIEQHVAHCAHCVRFQDDLEKIRMCVKTILQPTPPPDLVHKTGVICHAEISSKPGEAAGITSQAPSRPMPKYVWPVLLLLILLTAFVMAPALKNIRFDQPLTFESVAVLILVIQNAVMLFFAPILIRKYRWKKQNFGNIQINANVS